MAQNSVTGIIMATMSEAEPFVRHLLLKNYSDKPFEVYQNENIRLVISGMGKANAAMAATSLIMTDSPACIFNIGAAGGTDNSVFLGETFHISKVVEPDRPVLGTDRIHEHFPDIIKGFRTAVLATQDKPVIVPEEREKISAYAQLVDMEGASVLQTCRRFEIPCYLFKFVSDTPKNHKIRENIRLYREASAIFILKDIKLS